MLLHTYIARTTDGLPLVASVDADSNVSLLKDQKSQLKMITSRVTPTSEPRASIESGSYMIHYLIANDIIYMCITERKFPLKLVFSYLEELQKEFNTSYEAEALKPNTRAYAFSQFDNYIQKTKRLYQDARATQNLDRLNADLQDVTKVMTKNIEDLIYRGDSLDRMSDLSSSLREESKKYRRTARRVNLEAAFRQYAPIGGVVLIVLFLIWWRFF